MTFRYAPLFRPMDDYMMKHTVPDVEWQYVEASHLWPNSPLPRAASPYVYGIFTVSRLLTAEECARLEVRAV